MPHRLVLALVTASLILTLYPLEAVGQARCALGPVDFEGHRVSDLVRWFSDARKDQFTTTRPEEVGCVGDRIRRHDGYRLERIEGGVFSADAPQPPHTVPLHTWYSPSRREHFTTSDPRWQGQPGAPERDGYRYVRLEGYIHAPDRPQPQGTLPLHSWWNGRRQDNFTTTDPRWNTRRRETHRGYRRYRLEGYVIDPARTPSANRESLLPGCFVDTGERDLPVMVPGDRHTPAQCRAACLQRGHTYAGVQYGGQCFCGDRFGRYGAVGMDQCQMACRADERMKCGAGWRNMIERADVPERPVVQVERPRPDPSRSWPGIDLPGSDLRRIVLDAGAEPDACAAACGIERECQAYTYVRAGLQGPTPVCYLKNGVPTQRASDCCTSGVKLTKELATRRSTTTHTHINPAGPAPTTFQGCRQACADDPRCLSYSFDIGEQRCSLGSSRIQARPAGGRVSHISGIVPSTCRDYTVPEGPASIQFEHDSNARRTTGVEVYAPVQASFDLARAELLQPQGGEPVPLSCDYSRTRGRLRCGGSEGIDYCRLWELSYGAPNPVPTRLRLTSNYDGGQCAPTTFSLGPDLGQRAPNCTGTCPEDDFGIVRSSGEIADNTNFWTINTDAQSWRLVPSRVSVTGPAYITGVQLLATGGTLRRHYSDTCTARRINAYKHTITCRTTDVSRCALYQHVREGGTLQLSVSYARPAGCSPSAKRYEVRLGASLSRACETPSGGSGSGSGGGNSNAGGGGSSGSTAPTFVPFERDEICSISELRPGFVPVNHFDGRCGADSERYTAGQRFNTWTVARFDNLPDRGQVRLKICAGYQSLMSGWRELAGSRSHRGCGSVDSVMMCKLGTFGC